jgi:peptidoglycan-N-acetylglucosamine deacetylase
LERSNMRCATFAFLLLAMTLCSCSQTTRPAPQTSPQQSKEYFPDALQQPDNMVSPQSEERIGASPVSEAPKVLPEQPAPVPQPEAAPVPAPIKEPKPPTPQKREKKQEKPVSQQKQVSSTRKLSLSQLVRKYPDLLLLKGSSSSKKVALTFDDAPDTTFTPQVLDTLKKHKVKATFFLVGTQAAKHPDMVKRIVSEGHVIGNHTYDHKLLTKLSDDAFQQEIMRTQSILEKLCGYTPRLIRPPYGEISESQLLWASEHNYRIVNWNVDSNDWRQLSESQVSDNILKHTKAGSIVLQHSGGGPGQDLSGTVNALPHVIQTLQSRGYKLVTLPDLLGESKKK